MSEATTAPQDKKFGTLGGVFTPCTLTILGVIMFLRFGQVVGQAGVIYAVLIVLASKLITLLTTLSLSAIATNIRVKGGGAYFLISRSLGVEFGGAIGIVFFLAQAISVAMYVIGFSEAIVGVFGFGVGSMTTIATVTNLVVFVCVYIGAGWTIKMQYVILAVLAASLVSFYVGAINAFQWEYIEPTLKPHFTEGKNVFTMFALFFPAVTGIMAGANMSGDLKDPGRSIPLGTLASVGFTGVVYVSMAIVLGGAASHHDLIGNNMVLHEFARWPVLISAGVIAATLSSALGSMMGAPRILQAFARDEIFKSLRFFSAGSGPLNEPRRATILTYLIAQTCIFLGDLDAIAPVITMAFLITYGTLNLATFYEGVTKNPSYRPRFKYSHWTTSLLGAAGCLAVMFLISPIAAAVSIAAMAALQWYISSREIKSRWGDLQSGVSFERTRRNLLKLEGELYHPKNWRPIILALTGRGWDRAHLPIYGHWLTTGHGILSLGQVITGDIENRIDRRDAQEEILHRFIEEEELEAFPAVVVSQTLSQGIESLVQCHGLGALRPNTVLLGWPHDPERAQTFGTTLRTVDGLGRSLIAINAPGEASHPWDAPQGTIDVYWRGQKNGGLMLLLAHLLSTNDSWRNRPIRLLRIIASEEGREDVLSHLKKLAVTSRIHASAEVVVAENVPEAIQNTSRGAAVVFLGFEPPAEGKEEAFYEGMNRLAGDLRRVILVCSSGGMELES